jgi:arylsulfatase A-like enzyme
MADRPPNILWFCTDSQRWDTLGCYGNRFVTTPAADRLAAEGARFDCCISQSPLCTPSRGSFLTGRYPVTNRLRMNGQVCPPDLGPHLITNVLKSQAGYVNGLVGKLHLNACDNRLLLGAEWWKHDAKEWFRGMEPRIADGYDDFLWDHAPSGAFTSSAYTRWLIAHGYPRDESSPRDDCRFVTNGRPVQAHQTTWCAEESITFLNAHADQPYPWLLSVNVFDPHPGFNPPAECLAPYLDRLEDIPLPAYAEGEVSTRPAAQQEWFKGGHGLKWPEMNARDHRLCRAAYWAMCDLIDAQFARVLSALDRTGQRDNTVVIFTSDHGEMLGDHGLYVKGPAMYDAAVRVPLIIRWPGHIAAGQSIGGMVELADLVPTLLDAAGLQTPPGVQGLSFWPSLTDGHTPPRTDAYCEYYDGNPEGSFGTMIRTASHKLIRWHGRHRNAGAMTGARYDPPREVARLADDQGELYDLVHDPAERHNLWLDPTAGDIKRTLLMHLSDRMSACCDPQYPRIGVY